MSGSTHADLVLALDQGTTSSRAIAFDRTGRPVVTAHQAYEQRYPWPGHVTHDPEVSWESQSAAAREVVEQARGLGQFAAVGIANSAKPRSCGTARRASRWPTRSSGIAGSLRTAARRCVVRVTNRSSSPHGPAPGLYFSGPKIAHILDTSPGLRDRALAGELAFRTVDTFLLWRLTADHRHATDVSNASRTLLFDIHRLHWDADLCDLVDVPRAMLPDVLPSSGSFGETEPSLFGAPIPIRAVIGDQQAATFGQAALRPGQAKNTYGTGAFLLLNTGDQPMTSDHGLLTTILWQLQENGPVTYALEGSVFIAGAAVQWMRDGLRAITASSDIEALAAQVGASGGVYLFPAFTGLGAPHWDPHARGALLGLTRGSGLPEIARATIESIAYQVGDVLEALEADRGDRVEVLRVDGGAAENDTLLQFRADILDLPVDRPVVTETTALGAAYLAGLAAGLWTSVDEVAATWSLDRRFEPAIEPGQRARMRSGWRRAVDRVRDWVDPEDGVTPA